MSRSHGHHHTHDHSGHEHDEHGHDHDHHHAHPEPSQGPERTIRVDLPLILPRVADEHDQCIDRLQESLRTKRGFLSAHLEHAHDRATLCLHYDADALTLSQVTRLVEQAGAAITKRYRHETLWVRGMDSPDNAQDLERVVGRMPGIVAVSVNYAAERARLEYDLEATSRKKVLGEIARLGYRVEEDDEHAGDHEGHDHGRATVTTTPGTAMEPEASSSRS